MFERKGEHEVEQVREGDLETGIEGKGGGELTVLLVCRDAHTELGKDGDSLSGVLSSATFATSFYDVNDV